MQEVPVHKHTGLTKWKKTILWKNATPATCVCASFTIICVGVLLSKAPVSKYIGISLCWQIRQANAPHSSHTSDRNSSHSIQPLISVSFPTKQSETPVCGWVGDTTGLHHISINSPNNCTMPCYNVSQHKRKRNNLFMEVIT